MFGAYRRQYSLFERVVCRAIRERAPAEKAALQS